MIILRNVVHLTCSIFSLFILILMSSLGILFEDLKRINLFFLIFRDNLLHLTILQLYVIQNLNNSTEEVYTEVSLSENPIL